MTGCGSSGGLFGWTFHHQFAMRRRRYQRPAFCGGVGAAYPGTRAVGDLLRRDAGHHARRSPHVGAAGRTVVVPRTVLPGRDARRSSRIPRATRSVSWKPRPPDGSNHPMHVEPIGCFKSSACCGGAGRRRPRAHLAERLGVSERTVYRDVRDLVLAGTPIDGESRASATASVPATTCRRSCSTAMRSRRSCSARGSCVSSAIPRWRAPAARSSAKVAAIVPKDLAPLVAETRLFVPSTHRRCDHRPTR